MLFFCEQTQKRSNRPHGELLLTALAIIQRLKPRKFKDVHLNKSPMSALNNDGVSRLVVSQIVAKQYAQPQDRGLLSVMLLPISGFKIII